MLAIGLSWAKKIHLNVRYQCFLQYLWMSIKVWFRIEKNSGYSKQTVVTCFIGNLDYIACLQRKKQILGHDTRGNSTYVTKIGGIVLNWKVTEFQITEFQISMYKISCRHILQKLSFSSTMKLHWLAHVILVWKQNIWHKKIAQLGTFEGKWKNMGVFYVNWPVSPCF